MAPDEVLMLSKKLDETLAIVSDTRVQVSEVAVNLEAHIARDGERKEERELTCPVRPAVSKLVADVDAIGGIVRKVRVDIDDLQTWRTQEDKDDLITEARMKPLQSLGVWLANNAMSVMLALIVMYLAILLDLKG